MARATRVNGIESIKQQAQQGSMAAMIQLLSERLADQRIRTRTVFAEGALQLLGKAATPESFLVSRVQQLLKAIAPRNVRWESILASSIREQKLLWFDEVSRDPDYQLLWFQEITLNKPNLIRQLINKQPPERFVSLTKHQQLRKVPVGKRQNRYQCSFWEETSGVVIIDESSSLY